MSKLAALVLLAILLNPIAAMAEFTCPRTIPKGSLGPPMSPSETWFGTQSLAVNLPPDGVWHTTAPGHRIGVKVFWWSAGFRIGMESKLHVTIRELSGAPVTAVALKPTNAYGDDPEEAMILIGIDFPDTGCWEVTGEYLGQKLTFVVETIPSKAR